MPDGAAENGDEPGNLHLSMSINPSASNTLRLSTPKLTKHQTLGTTIMSRSGRSDKARRAQGMRLIAQNLSRSVLMCRPTM